MWSLVSVGTSPGCRALSVLTRHTLSKGCQTRSLMGISRAQVVLNREPRTTDYQLRATYAEKKTSDYGQYPPYVKMWPLWTLTTLAGCAVAHMIFYPPGKAGDGFAASAYAGEHTLLRSYDGETIKTITKVTPMGKFISNENRPSCEASTDVDREIAELLNQPSEDAEPSDDAKPADDAAEETTETERTAAGTDLPSHVPYLLIGGGLASLSAFKAIKTNDMKAKVLMVGEETYPPYARPPLSKQFWFNENSNAVQTFQYTGYNGKPRSVFYAPGLYMQPSELGNAENGGLALLSGRKVVKLDVVKKSATLDDGTEIGYDKCLVATGGRPKNLKVIEEAGEEVAKRTVLYRDLNDLRRLSEATSSAKSVAIIGGGFLGSELAVALGYKGKETGTKVHQVIAEKGNMGKVLPESLSRWTTRKMEKEGVNVITKTNVKSASFVDDQVKLDLSNGTSLSVDQVIVAVGIEPRTELADSSGLEVDDSIGGFVVNSELQARSDVWVAGDASCFYDVKLGRRRVEHYDHAEVTGRLAGENMTGQRNPYKHQSYFWSDLGRDVSFEAVGMVDSSLPTFCVYTKPEHFPMQNLSPDTKVQLPTDPIERQLAIIAIIRAERRAEARESMTQEETAQRQVSPPAEDEYNKGVVFYQKNKRVVGVLLWNLTSQQETSRLDIARMVIEDGCRDKDLSEVAKYFNIFDKEDPESNSEPEKKLASAAS